jgi:hypothetical protein
MSEGEQVPRYSRPHESAVPPLPAGTLQLRQQVLQAARHVARVLRHFLKDKNIMLLVIYLTFEHSNVS